MKYLKGFNINEAIKSKSFLEDNPDIEDVLSPLIDLESDPVVLHRWYDGDEYVSKKPNDIEVMEVFQIEFKFKNDVDYNIELLQSFKSITKRIEVYSRRLGFDFMFNFQSGIKIYLSRTVRNEDYISYGGEFRKIIDIDKHYWVLSFNQPQIDLYFDQFVIPDDNNDYITHGQRGNYFNLGELRKSVGNLLSSSSYRIVLPEGEESKVYKVCFGSEPKDEMEMFTSLRQKLLLGYNRFSEKTDIIRRMKMFDDTMSKIYPKYRSYNLSEDDKNFKYRINR